MKNAVTVLCVMLLSAAIYSSAAFVQAGSQPSATQSFIGTTPDAPAVEAQAPTF
jgi:hypothetical protein